MPVDDREEDAEPIADEWPSQARRWCRAALVLALLSAGLPVVGVLFLGSWEFEGSFGIACLCLIAAAYLYIAGRPARPPLPDPSTILDQAIQLAASGDTDRGIQLLDEVLRLSPRLWQARQYRGQMRLVEPTAAEAVLQDFTEAIRLAPEERHLYVLRSHIFAMLGRDSSARADLETAARLHGDSDEAPGPSAPR